MANFIQVLDGKVVNHWDIPETLPSPLGTNGWKTTVEDIPTIQDGRQAYGVYTYDVTKDPVVISREVIEISVDDRKKELLEINTKKFIQFVEILNQNSSLYSQEEIATNKSISRNNKTLIESASTHDELDALTLAELNFF